MTATARWATAVSITEVLGLAEGCQMRARRIGSARRTPQAREVQGTPRSPRAGSCSSRAFAVLREPGMPPCSGTRSRPGRWAPPGVDDRAACSRRDHGGTCLSQACTAAPCHGRPASDMSSNSRGVTTFGRGWKLDQPAVAGYEQRAVSSGPGRERSRRSGVCMATRDHMTAWPWARGHQRCVPLGW